MAPFIILSVVWLALGGIGWLGVAYLSSWQTTGRLALAVMFMFTGATHFSALKTDYLAMVPEPFPQNLGVIYLAGLLELLGGIGLLMPQTSRRAGICLALLLVLMFPANIYAAVEGIPFGGRSPTPLFARTLIQAFFVASLWFATFHRPSDRSAQRESDSPQTAGRDSPNI